MRPLVNPSLLARGLTLFRERKMGSCTFAFEHEQYPGSPANEKGQPHYYGCPFLVVIRDCQYTRGLAGCSPGQDFKAAFSFSCFSSSHLTGMLQPGQYPE
jgi:hypothetical protein